MIYNYLAETDLQGFLYEKELFKWTGQTDFSEAKSQAEQIVLSDLINKGYKAEISRPDLYLRDDTDTLSADSTGDSIEDKFNRLRLGYNVTVRTGTTALVLQGSNDETTWTTITTQSITATGRGSFVFISAFKYYRINSTITSGTLAFTAWLTEINWDLLFKYKWFEIILINAGKGDDNKYTHYAMYFKKEYDGLLNSGIFLTDPDLDGEIVAEKISIIDRLN